MQGLQQWEQTLDRNITQSQPACHSVALVSGTVCLGCVLLHMFSCTTSPSHFHFPTFLKTRSQISGSQKYLLLLTSILGAICPTILGCHLARDYGENCCLPLAPGGLVALRTHMRLSYNIEGTICNDVLMMLFCGPCEICRMARELRNHNG
ncbi:cornifelin homolog B-like isoform X1 [Heterodontus francisci]|uniref:cornifelin homolog B-like isoform X1 n=1 Tax=Heterodontus francisci TaxID=7792 RepID=UPI00355B1847